MSLLVVVLVALFAAGVLAVVGAGVMLSGAGAQGGPDAPFGWLVGGCLAGIAATIGLVVSAIAGIPGAGAALFWGFVAVVGIVALFALAIAALRRWGR